MIKIMDTHAHYDDDAFDEDREQLLAQLSEQGIRKIVNIGASLASCKRTIQLMDGYDYIYGAIGVHPNETAELNEENFLWLKEQCMHPKCVAVGEIGLDYYWPEPERDVQKKWFVRQMDLAHELHKPVVIHSRDAAQDTMDMMKAERAGEIGGVIHCFSYSKEVARTFLDMGFYLGIGGVVTFQNSHKLKEVVEYMPLDRLVLETDAPYLAPVPYRGKRNCSAYLTHVVEQIAQLRKITAEQVMESAWENAHRLYRMPLE